jgi:hypothetical protein
MSCTYAKSLGGGIYLCEVSNDECYFEHPNSQSCAEMYGEGPDSKNKTNDNIRETEDEISDEDGDFGSDE